MLKRYEESQVPPNKRQAADDPLRPVVKLKAILVPVTLDSNIQSISNRCGEDI